MEKLTTWQILGARLDWHTFAQGLHAQFLTRDLAVGCTFVTAVSEPPRRQQTPGVRLTVPLVDIRLISHDVGG
ncbi:MAG: hypothetical protein ABJA34_00490 [Pseudonocardiales bacterium]